MNKLELFSVADLDEVRDPRSLVSLETRAGSPAYDQRGGGRD